MTGAWEYGTVGEKGEKTMCLEHSLDQIQIFVARKTLGCTYVPLFIYQGIKKYHNKYFEKPSVYGTLNYHTGVKEWESLEELIYDS